MAGQITLASLLSLTTKDGFYAKGLAIVESLGVTVTSWRAGDPTRSLYHYLAEMLTVLEPVVREFIAGGFLEFASGEWLTILAKQVYNVDRDEATFAGDALVLENTEPYLYEIEAGDLTFKSSATGQTYHNTTGGTLSPGPGTTLELEWVADEAGSDSSVSADEIDELVTTLLGVEIQSSGAGVGVDEQTDAALKAECSASVGGISPNGPAEAYQSVALNSTLTGVTDVTKAEVDGDSDTGDVTLYLAGPSGPVQSESVDAVADAIALWATPLTITPSVVNATEVAVAISMTVYIYSSVGETEAVIQSTVSDRLQDVFTELAIGGDDGELDPSKLSSAAFASFPGYVHKVVVATPAAAVAIDAGEIATIDGTPTINVVFTAVT